MKPTGTRVSRTKLCSSRPAPTSSISDSATSATTSALRGPRRDAVAPRPPLFSASTGDWRAASDAGIRPKSRPAATDTASENASTRPSTAISRSARQAAQRRRGEVHAPEREQHAEPAAGQRRAPGSRCTSSASDPSGWRRAPARTAASCERAVARDQQQVGDVGAGDQQHEADRAHQHQQRRSRAADRPLANRREPQARIGIGIGVGRVCARVGVGDRVDLALRLLRRRRPVRSGRPPSGSRGRRRSDCAGSR